MVIDECFSQVTSYGGFLRFTVSHTDGHTSTDFFPDIFPDVELRVGNFSFYAYYWIVFIITEHLL